MKKLIPIFFVVFLSGCMAVSSGRKQASRAETDIEQVKIDLQRLREQIDGISVAQQDLSNEMRELRASSGNNNSEMDAKLAEMRKAVKAAELSIGQLKPEIIAELSGKLANIMSMQGGSSSGEHVVRTGETLSAIASAYGVKMSAIIRVNNLRNPDNLKVGQKLIIPE